MNEPIDASVPGVLDTGNARIYSLGNNAFVVIAAQVLVNAIRDVYGTEWYVELKTALHADSLLCLVAMDDNLGSFIPLAASDDLKAVLRPLVAELMGELKQS